ncbi:MAG: hypothetical protein LBH82_07275 [Bacteroidales bacterium]|jgi:hypothetical protein|nr:hypothetical protein [Bacteroidales bacterium]
MTLGRNRIVCLLGLLLSVSAGSAYAQTYDPPLRIELEVEAQKYPYNLRLTGKNGLVLIARNNAKDVGRWTISHYDTNFTLLLKKDIALDMPLVLSAARSDENNFYALLQSPASNRENVANTFIISYHILSKKIDVFSIYLPDKQTINNIAYLGDVFSINSYSAKKEEHVYLFNKKTLTLSELYVGKKFPTEFQQYFHDTLTNSLWVLVKSFVSKQQTMFTLTQLNTNGNIIFEKEIIPDDTYYLQSCNIIRMDSSSLMLTGDYGINSKETFTTQNNNSGFFTVLIINNEMENIRYIPYDTVDGLGESGKKKTDLYSNSYLAAYNDSMLIYVSDFFTPEYVHEVYPDSRFTSYGMWGSSAYSSTNAKLVGFKYHLAYLFIIDKSGKLAWYNVFNYNGLLFKSVNNVIKAHIDAENFNTLYYFSFDGKLYSLINNRNEIIQPLNIETIDLQSRFLHVESNLLFQSSHWYNNYFVYYGYQRLNNKYTTPRKSTKYVFYVNKLVYK